MELKNCTFLQVKGGQDLGWIVNDGRIKGIWEAFAGRFVIIINIIIINIIIINIIIMTITYYIIILKIDSLMIIIFIIIIHIILNEKGAFVINLINILIILITMMTVIRFAINIDVVMMVFMKSCLDQTQT